MSNNETMSKSELEHVAGGGATPYSLNELVCMYCGKPLKPTTASMGLDNGRWADYIDHTCPACREEHPYKKLPSISEKLKQHREQLQLERLANHESSHGPNI